MSIEFDLDEALVTGPRGTVFGPLSHGTGTSAAGAGAATTTATRTMPEVATGRGITVVLGQQGSGRTSLLLCLAGRMRLTGGSLRVLGTSSLAEIRALTAIAGFAEIDALEPSVTVGATLRERLAWALPWYRRAPRVTQKVAHELLTPAFGDPTPTVRTTNVSAGAGTTGVAQPAPRTLVRDLDPAQAVLLRIALALIDDPQMLVIDDFDELKNPRDRQRVAERLSALSRDGIGVVLATSDPRDVELFGPGGADLLEL